LIASPPAPNLSSPPFPTRRSSALHIDVVGALLETRDFGGNTGLGDAACLDMRLCRPHQFVLLPLQTGAGGKAEEHTSELQSRGHLVCRLLLEKKKKKQESNIVQL